MASRRRTFSDKCFGIFECARVSDHPLTAGAPSRLQMPHSRWNDIPEDALTSCGYRVLTRSEDAGVDTFVKQRKSLFVFFQGHPEYEANTLLLEYRRDIRRFLRRERDTYPPMPQGYFRRRHRRCIDRRTRASPLGSARGGIRRVPNCPRGRKSNEHVAFDSGAHLSQLAVVHMRAEGSTAAGAVRSKRCDE